VADEINLKGDDMALGPNRSPVDQVVPCSNPSSGLATSYNATKILL